jgi:penicillin-binding protein 2
LNARIASFRFRFRIAVAGGRGAGGLSLLIARFFHLQVVQHDYYTTRAEDNRISLVPIVPNRGVIVDRATARPGAQLLGLHAGNHAVEGRGPRRDDRRSGKVIEILPKDRKRFRKLLEESKNFESLPIRTRLSEEEVARFAANRYLFPGVEVKARLFRQYPLGSVASHAIGYINRINKRDLEMIEESEQAANYKGTDHIGKTGLEQKYEFQPCTAKPAMSRSKSTPAAGPFAVCRVRRRCRATT